AWSFIFIGVIRELSASILLFAPASKVVSVVIFDLKEEGQVGVISVLGILLLVVSFAVILAMQWFAGRDVVATREEWMANVFLDGLTKKFTGMAAVDDLRLEIKDGEFVSLLGPSGCGKTTTLRLVAGFLQPDAGEIRVNDKVISSASILIPPERRNMSMIFQSYAIWPHMTVFQNVAYGLKFKNLTSREVDEKTERLLRVVHLEALKARYPAELSGGQQQRVALARALVVEPQILLLDEPLSNLDANLREEMRFEIRRLHEEF